MLGTGGLLLVARESRDRFPGTLGALALHRRDDPGLRRRGEAHLRAKKHPPGNRRRGNRRSRHQRRPQRRPVRRRNKGCRIQRPGRRQPDGWQDGHLLGTGPVRPAGGLVGANRPGADRIGHPDRPRVCRRRARRPFPPLQGDHLPGRETGRTDDIPHPVHHGQTGQERAPVRDRSDQAAGDQVAGCRRRLQRRRDPLRGCRDNGQRLRKGERGFPGHVRGPSTRTERGRPLFPGR